MRTVLVTGANRGIGLEFAKQYASDEDQVIAICRNDDYTDELKIISKKNNIRIKLADMSDFKSIDILQNELSGIPIDIIINNAGVFGPKAQADGDLRQSFGHMNYDVWRKLMDINTLAPYKIVESLIENIRLGKDKKVITISSSIASIEDVSPGVNAYRASKCAVNMVMASLAMELKDQGIKFALLCPGWVNTRMGGEKAPITPEVSVSGLRKVINNLSIEGYSLVDEGTVDSLDIVYLLQGQIGQGTAVNAAVGIGGGSWKDYEDKNGNLLMSLKISGDNTEELIEIYDAFISWADAQLRFSEKTDNNFSGKLYIGGTNFWIENDGNFLRIVLSQDLKILENILTECSSESCVRDF